MKKSGCPRREVCPLRTTVRILLYYMAFSDGLGQVLAMALIVTRLLSLLRKRSLRLLIFAGNKHW